MPRQTALVVDDEPGLRMALGFLLEGEGFEVQAASDGADAVALLEKSDFDLVIMDIRMPAMDGVSALRAVRESGVTVPVILASSHGTPEQVVEAVRAGVSGFLAKPLKPADARLAVKKVFSREEPIANRFEKALGLVSKRDLPAAMEELKLEESDGREAIFRDVLEVALTNGKAESLPHDVFDKLSYLD